MADHHRDPGVWITYAYDVSPYVVGIYEHEIEALRAANGSGYLSVTFVPFGERVSDRTFDPDRRP